MTTTTDIPMDKLQEIVRRAEERNAAATVESACRVVGVGLRTLQSRERTADTARRRAVVAWILCDRLNWPQDKAAAVLKRTVRQVERMLRSQR